MKVLVVDVGGTHVKILLRSHRSMKTPTNGPSALYGTRATAKTPSRVAASLASPPARAIAAMPRRQSATCARYPISQASSMLSR